MIDKYISIARTNTNWNLMYEEYKNTTLRLSKM
jgi:hypothetical protein